MRIFDWIWAEGWGRSWGIFLWSTLTFDGLRGHFRKLTKIRTESGQVLIFRFYDPRVLSMVLPTFDPAQVREFFGPTNRFSVETSEGRAIEQFSQTDGILKRTTSDIS